MTNAIKGLTATYSFKLVSFDFPSWQSYEHSNWKLLDAILSSFVSPTGTKGLWDNDLAVNVGEIWIDADTSELFKVLVAHTSATSPTTFAQDRAANPTYWQSINFAANNAGAWVANRAYQRNDFVVNGQQYGVVKSNFVSSNSFANDVAAGNIIVLLDLTGSGSGNVSGAANSADGELVLFSGTTGKTIKRSNKVVSAFILSLIDAADQATALATLNAQAVMTKAVDTDVKGKTNDTKYLTIKAIQDALVPTVLTDAASIALDLSTGINFIVTLGGNRTLAAPTNLVAGASGIIYILQDATGGRTLSLSSAYKTPNGVGLTLSAGANAVDRVPYFVRTISGSPVMELGSVERSIK